MPDRSKYIGPLSSLHRAFCRTMLRFRWGCWSLLFLLACPNIFHLDHVLSGTAQKTQGFDHHSPFGGIGWRHEATYLQTNLHVCLVSLHASKCLAFEIDQLERDARKSTILITTAPFLKELASTVLTAERRLEFEKFLVICLSNLCKSY